MEIHDFPEWAENWLGKQVKFTLLGARCTGIVREVLDTVCAPGFLIAEFRDGNKQVKVGGPIEDFHLASIS